jgi:hypothetical protein
MELQKKMNDRPPPQHVLFEMLSAQRIEQDLIAHRALG